MIKGKKILWKYKNSARQALHEVCFELKQGRITTFMGPSGSGKTTLLKCVANLHSDYEGTILCEGKDLKTLDPIERSKAVGFVLQQFHLFPHLTTLQNCTLALQEVIGFSKQDAIVKGTAMLNALRLGPFLHVFPAHLSGGQQQRVAIARALVLSPKVLLLDEPTSALDPVSRQNLENLLLELNAKGVTIGLSSHDMPFIHKMKDSIYFMEEGKILESWDQKQEEISNAPRISKFLTHS